MKRIEQLFKEKKPFIAYITAGDGGLEYTKEACLSLIGAGVDLIEIGVPFSDPIADGPTIQRAMQRALKEGTTLKETLLMIKELREKSDASFVLFSYYNPIYALGDEFFHLVKESGVDGVIVVDLNLDEAAEFEKALKKDEISLIYIATVSTTPSRAREIAKHTTSFIYYACQKGTTGLKASLPEGFKEKLQELKSASKYPVAVGFGISSKKMASDVLEYADGFVVGSYFVDAIEKGKSPQELAKLAKEIDPR